MDSADNDDEMKEAHASVFGTSLAWFIRDGWSQLHSHSNDVSYCWRMLEAEQDIIAIDDIRVPEQPRDRCVRWKKEVKAEKPGSSALAGQKNQLEKK